LKILQLFSDWKWTGPAEPVLILCKELERRGHEVTLAYRKAPPRVDDSLEKRILAAGVKATGQFRLNHVVKLLRPSSLVDNLWDFRHLVGYLEEEAFDVVNVHHSHDHILGGIAVKKLSHPPVLIRTDHKRYGLKRSLGNRFLITHLTDGILTFSEQARKKEMDHFGMPAERIGRIPVALDLSQYDPRREYKEMRPMFGIGSRETIIGMIARYQKYRRTDVFLEGMKQVVREFPEAKILLVGRSGQMNESVIQPMKRLGMEPWVSLAGYRTDDYLDTLACMDIFVFLMPGSDGTARALREAMAMGKAVVVANRGMLPELVDDGVTGLVVQDTPEGLSRAVLKLLRDPGLRDAMAKAAYEKAHREFRLDRQAEAVEQFYQEMVALGKWKKKANKRANGKHE
jgi:glycosyltransferase involved in cell wall biosynthesis